MAASALLTRLDDKRRVRWSEAINSIDITHSSGREWNTTNNLTGRSRQPLRLCPNCANSIASKLVKFPRTAWVRLNRLRTGVGLFRSTMYKWGMAPTAACECGAEEQTADHIITTCPMYRYPNGAQGLAQTDDNLLKWLSETCPTI